MNEEELKERFSPLWSDVPEADQFYTKKPLLAHYCSIEVLEKILLNDEIWFSNPLYMNDLEEVRFGIDNSVPLVLTNSLIFQTLKTPERRERFNSEFSRVVKIFTNDHVFDTYVFCMSEHSREQNDGLLSMWRGYGGDGSGAAVVFDASKINVVHSSAFMISRVHYATGRERGEWIDRTIKGFCDILAKGEEIPTDKLGIAAFLLFERIKTFALFTKHPGFREEAEWRAVYWKSRDPRDTLKPFLDYSIRPGRVAPILKFKIRPIAGLTAEDFSLEKIVQQLIIGPCISSNLTMRVMQRVLEKSNKTALSPRLYASRIPYRNSYWDRGRKSLERFVTRSALRLNLACKLNESRPQTLCLCSSVCAHSKSAVVSSVGSIAQVWSVTTLVS